MYALQHTQTNMYALQTLQHTTTHYNTMTFHLPSFAWHDPEYYITSMIAFKMALIIK